MPQEITTKTDQYGNVQSGYYIETPVTELYKGEETSKTVRIWVPLLNEPSDLKTLGNDYETNGPTGAPKILALLHLVPKGSQIVQAESAEINSLVLSFYRLTKSSDYVDKLKQREYDQHEQSDTKEVQTVIRWKYTPLFIGISENQITGQSVINHTDLWVLEFGPEETVFNAEHFYLSNRTVLDKSVGPAVALISFDEDESERQSVTNVEVLSKQFPTNKDGNSWIVPAKLSNPKCIHVHTNYCDNFRGYLSYKDEQATLAKMGQILADHSRKKTEVADQNRRLDDEITQLQQKHDSKIKEIQHTNLSFFKDRRIANRVEQYKQSKEYKDEIKQIQEKKTQKNKNNEDLGQLVTQYKQEYDKIKKPIVYYGVLYDLNPEIRFFIEPQFSEGSLVNLVNNKCITPSGGKRRNNNCYLQFRKTKRRNAKPLRKNTKKYYRRSNRK
jgi:hypothetical protein